MTVKDLVELLCKLPPQTPLYTCGLEGIFPAEHGNLFPVKVVQFKNDIKLYFDDGITAHPIIDIWEPLDQFVYIDKEELQ